MIKSSSVAGQFYPGNKKDLEKILSNFFNKSISPEIKSPKGIIAPHAGYIYSGQTATYAYKTLQNKNYDNIILLAPAHHLAFTGAARHNATEFLTPLGVIPVNQTTLLNEHIELIPEAFNEHSLEVQLPFLQMVLKNFQIIPLMLGRMDLELCQNLANLLIQIPGENLIIASTDLAHYHPAPENNFLDSETIKHIENLNPENLYQAALNETAELCGLWPVITLLHIAQQKKYQIKILKHSNSGEITRDNGPVVGYMSAVLF